MNFTRLIIQERRDGPISVVCQKETADYFGWSSEFDPWLDRYRPDYYYGPIKNQARLRNDPRHPGGKRLFICRDKSTTGHPQGSTHCFRMRGSFSRKHLVELARVARGKFEWMEGQYGARIRHAQWMDLVGDE